MTLKRVASSYHNFDQEDSYDDDYSDHDYSDHEDEYYYSEEEYDDWEDRLDLFYQTFKKSWNF